MSLNETPASERACIGFFGICNAGKSSVVNAVTGQDLAIVSDTRGTTTDPVRKTMEILPLGPVVVIDTPGIDDAGALGSLRVRKAQEVTRSCDIAVLVLDATCGMQQADRDLIALMAENGTPAIVAWNKADLLTAAERITLESRLAAHCDKASVQQDTSAPVRECLVSAVTGEGIHELKEAIGHCMRHTEPKKRLVADLVSEGDLAVLVVPIDSSAPKGRLILPQQMVLRDLLDTHATGLVCQPEELAGVLAALPAAPRIVITDSQAFAQVARTVPQDIPLTSFSILMARYRGSLSSFAEGARALARLRDNDLVLVCEACTHHRQCEDIGTVKIPRMIREFTGANPRFQFTSGGQFPDSLEGVSLVVHCGGCMINDKEMASRTNRAQSQGVPMINYGMALAHMNGILARSLAPLPESFELPRMQ